MVSWTRDLSLVYCFNMEGFFKSLFLATFFFHDQYYSFYKVLCCNWRFRESHSVFTFWLHDILLVIIILLLVEASDNLLTVKCDLAK